jgi:hypothetical protein
MARNLSAGLWLDLYNYRTYPEIAANLNIYSILESKDSPIIARGVQF